MSYVSPRLRQQIIARASERCEYCLYPQHTSLLLFEIEHIIAEKHGGTTTAANLALACPYCNRYKGTGLGSLDPETQRLIPFYHPRRQSWDDHFYLDGAIIMPRTAEGRVTVAILQVNHPDRLQERMHLLAVGLYP